MADKHAIRAMMRQRAAAFLASGQAAPESARILAELEAMPAFHDAACVLVYMALPDEVQTAPLLERWAGRKRLVIPRVAGEDLELCEYDPARLQTGYRGILEPAPDALPVCPDEIDLAVVPGTAFSQGQNVWRLGRGSEEQSDAGGLGGTPPNQTNTKTVWRLGRGKGFYDRLLPRLRCPAVGICYPFRVLPEIPTDPWDQPLGGLVY